MQGEDGVPYLRFMVFNPSATTDVRGGENRVTETTLNQFKKELDSFVVIVSMNMAAGALAMALAMTWIIVAVQGLPVWQIPAPLRIPVAILFMICFGFGLNWIVTSGRILRGVKQVRREYRRRNGPVPDEILTCWIVRVLAHYRENRPVIRWMVPVSIAGGSAFLLLGLSNLVQGIWGGDDPLRWFAFIAAAINITVGSASIVGVRYFRRYSAAWDERIEAAARSENALQCALERR